MLKRLVNNALFWCGVVIVLAGVGLMLAGQDVFAGGACAVGLVLALVAVVVSSQTPKTARRFADMDSGPTVVDLGDETAKTPPKNVLDLDS